MARRFNTAGPCDPIRHHMIPALSRLPEAPGLVAQEAFFVVHAPRQTGKTTALRVLAHELTARGRFAALHFSCETAEAAGDDYDAAARDILFQIRVRAEDNLPAELRPPAWPAAPAGSQLSAALRAWAQACPRPLVLFFDEVDAVRGQSLVSVLPQLRAGFPDRPRDFPASAVLCGLRDVSEYKALAGGDPSRLGTASPFNVKLKSLRLGDFSPDEVAELYSQHTAETGQEFSPAALARAYELTGGQPWLVNALAREVVEEIAVPTSETITARHLDEAKERLILARATHLDSLASKLAEPRVQRILSPVLAGGSLPLEPYDDDVAYVRDLGLIAPNPPVRIANPIYREVIARVLSSSIQESVTASPRSFIRSDNSFDFRKVLVEFAGWWTENGEFLTRRGYYDEAAPQLIFMGYLQRVVNGGGYVEREFAVGSGRVDLHVRWPYTTPGGERCEQREAVELKTWREGRGNPLKAGLRQLDQYLDRLHLSTGTLMIFDQRPAAPPIDERTAITTTTSPAGRTVTVLNG
ncbi:AAA ATPase domain-containing protein [Parafrankia irregularis]|uniref:AAA ATPase domain-containing protein n=1 Tax=Parafrankia irregularis TaxID=795642 RepID=A0A0S4QV82_9ACTN|nr:MULTISPECIES: AAA family ATPase [Parafrankia]MBE3202466.1 ATP-binding protein [Parafrankia sp. CH37]CUU59611.1 AAA ATPase domain-containing protein [Parafrankia irregularis]